MSAVRQRPSGKIVRQRSAGEGRHASPVAFVQPAPRAFSTGSPSQRQGHAAETRALDFLLAHGLRPVTRNAGMRVGEIDLVMRDVDEWVFIEVRSRRGAGFGGAAGSVTAVKQARLRRAAQTYLLQVFGQREWPPCRFDVVGIEGERIEWIRGAF